MTHTTYVVEWSSRLDMQNFHRSEFTDKDSAEQEYAFREEDGYYARLKEVTTKLLRHTG